MQPATTNTLTPDVETAIDIYERTLKPLLEPDRNGEAIAIDANSGEYAIGPSHSAASRELRARQIPNAQIVTLTIGPPTARDISIAQRIMGLRG